MHSTTLLLIHESPLVRGLLCKFIVSELTHFKIIKVDSAAKARKKITREKVDLIISGNQLKGLDGVELFKIAKQSKINHTTPFILVTSSSSEDAQREYKEVGLEQILYLPVTPFSLRESIKKVFDNRKKRRHDRFVVAGLESIIHLEGRDISASGINISMQSLYCEFELSAEEVGFFDSLYVTLKFPKAYHSYHFPRVWCRLVKVKICGWDTQFRAKKVQVIWEFIDFPDDKLQLWAELIDQLEREYENMAGVEG